MSAVTKQKGRGLVLLVSFGVLSCQNVGLPTTAGGWASRSVSAINRGKGDLNEASRMSKQCDALKGKAVVFEEERALGGAVAIALARKAERGVYVDALTGSARSLQRQIDAKQLPKLSEGTKTKVNRYLNEIGRKLTEFSSRPSLSWTFGALDSDVPNAFSAPGGYVFITTGLLRRLSSETELAGILAHEIGHVSERHAIEAYKEVKVDSCKWSVNVYRAKAAGSMAAEMAGIRADSSNPFLQAASSVSGVFNLNGREFTKEMIQKLTESFVEKWTTQGNSKEAERVADEIAVDLMAFAGYNPEALATVLLRMPPSGGGSYDHHPSNSDRAKWIRDRIVKQYQDWPSFNELNSFPLQQWF